MPETIVVLDPIAEERLVRMRALLPEGFVLERGRSREEADQLAAIKMGGYAITGDVPVTAAMMRAGAETGLRAVQKWGVGFDNIDLDAARANGVRVMRTTGSNAKAVAETTLAMMMALQRSLVVGHMMLLRGEWGKAAVGPTTFLLSGKTVGLVGLGYIGKEVARLLKLFGCRVLYTKPTPLPADEAAELGAEHVDFATLIAESDIVSLHCLLTEATRNLIGAAEIAAMKDGVLIINTARGGIVDEAALLAALKSGKVRGAGLDVFEIEPAGTDNPLVGLDNVIVTPHIGAQAADTFARNVTRMFANIAAVAEGRDPPAIDVLV